MRFRADVSDVSALLGRWNELQQQQQPSAATPTTPTPTHANARVDVSPALLLLLSGPLTAMSHLGTYCLVVLSPELVRLMMTPDIAETQGEQAYADIPTVLAPKRSALAYDHVLLCVFLFPHSSRLALLSSRLPQSAVFEPGFKCASLLHNEIPLLIFIQSFIKVLKVRRGGMRENMWGGGDANRVEEARQRRSAQLPLALCPRVFLPVLRAARSPPLRR